jgi:dTDP-L-rhamnose 4-epimerase
MLRLVRILVTGGLGFIGSHVVDALVSSGHVPVVLDAAAGRLDAEQVRADVRDRAAVEAALRGVDAVCHQAAKVGHGVDIDDYPEYAEQNDVGTAVLLAAMASVGVRSLVLASSMVVYGEGAYTCPAHGRVPPGPRTAEALSAGTFEPPCPRCGGGLEPDLVTEEAPFDPRNSYAVSKVAGEQYAAVWARATGGAVIALRYHNVYGPRLPLDTPYCGVAAVFRSALRRGEAPRVFEDGAQRRDFVHVRDTAQANVTALAAVAGGDGHAGALRAYNVGSGTARTVGDMATVMASVMGGPAPVVTGEYRLGDVRHITASSERIRHELGWRARLPFDHGVAELAAENAS